MANKESATGTPGPTSAPSTATPARKVSRPAAASPAAAKPVVKAASTSARSRPMPKPAEKVIAPPASTAVPSIKAEKPAKPNKIKKIKMIRDSFTMPENDYERIAELKKKCLKNGIHMKKSELLRAGLIKLGQLSDADLLKVVREVEILKTGRPSKH